MFYVPKPNDGDLEKDVKESSSFSVNDNGSSKSQAARLDIYVVEGRNLASMDIGGKSDPYCIITVGDEEQKTAVQYSTVDPKWNARFSFVIYNGPHFRSCDDVIFDGEDVKKNARTIYYVIVDVWDKDTLNRDDFMGRVMVPVSFLSQQTLSGWFSLGRTSARDVPFSGEIYIELSIQSSEPITRWYVDDQLHKCCEGIKDFELPVQYLSTVIQYPGETERVEMVLENVVIEVSRHRDLATVYLTDYRLLIICKQNERNSQDNSMWIAFKNIQSVDKAEDEKAVRRSLSSGARRTSIVKCLTIHCCDFKTIRLTFTDSNQSPQGFNSPGVKLKEALLIADCSPETGEVPSEKEKFPALSVPRIEVLQGEDNIDSGSDTWSLCEDDDLEEGEELTTDALKQCYGSSPVMIKASSSSNLLSDISRLLTNVQSVFTPTSTPPNSSGGKFYSNPIEPLADGSFVAEYVNIFYLRLTFFMLNITGSPLSRDFVRAFPQNSLCGCVVYDVKEEFQRQKVNSSWRLSEINTSYETCHSYPRLLYVPATVEDGILRKCAAFRSKGRLPVLCWFNEKKGNFIMRCAQPRTGARKKFSVDDEYVLQTAVTSNSYSGKMVIFDARSAIAASGNQLKGKGTEDVDRYPGCKLTFLNIPNIHAVRESLEKLQAACETSSQKRWFAQLEASQWLTYISLILHGAISIVRHVDEKGVAALIHCSDGWDRTSQLSALAQILLDPYYRTIKGFQVLVEKEWISFGHRFRDRNGHPSTNSNQRSPIFLQFLDCVWQILIQFPNSFEFSSEYLLRIVDHVNSGWFGTFMCNNEKERDEEEFSHCTVSLWAHLNSVRDVFRNESYVLNEEVLRPTSSLRRLRLWSDYYLRYDETFLSANNWLFDLKQQNETDEGVTGQVTSETVVWVANERVKKCHDCKMKFTHFNRRHHCRACGQIFCNECSSHRIHLPKFGYTKQERVCDRCFIKHKQEKWQSDESPVILRPKMEGPRPVTGSCQDACVSSSDGRQTISVHNGYKYCCWKTNGRTNDGLTARMITE